MNSSLRRRAAGWCLAACCAVALTAAGVSESGTDSYPGSEEVRYDRAPARVLPDTLAVAERAGSVLILPLPPTLRSGPVDSYEAISLPPLSLVRDRSFFWRTSTAEIGVHDLLFRALLNDGQQDTLVVEVSLLPARDG